MRETYLEGPDGRTLTIDQVPDGVRLVAGMTATVQVDARPGRRGD